MIYVRPLVDQVRETATLWEFELFQRGWNNLPKELQYGVVLKGYEDGFLLVEWVAVSHTVLVAIDELKLLKMGGAYASL